METIDPIDFGDAQVPDFGLFGPPRQRRGRSRGGAHWVEREQDLRQPAAAQLRSKGMLTTKPKAIELKVLRGDWTEKSAHQAVKSWLSLSTSRQLHIRVVMCQNDAMAMGARKAFTDLTEKDRDHWLNTPFTGCDGVPKTGQEWVRRGLLTATVVTPPTSSLALEVLVKAIRMGTMPTECTFNSPRSFPKLDELGGKTGQTTPSNTAMHK